MRFVLSVLFLFLASDSFAQVSIVQIGDSVGGAERNRSTTSQWFADRGLTSPDWIGNRGTPPTFAIGGFTYQNMLEGRNAGELGFSEIADSYAAPDVVYILGGYNDVVRAVNDSDMQIVIGRARMLLDAIENEWPETQIYLSNITLLSDAGNWAHKQSNVLTLNALISQEAASRESVTLVDNYSVIAAGDLNSDGLHLNNSGQLKIGENFASVLSDTFLAYEQELEPVVGDVNQDGLVSFSDIPPFISVLQSGDFLPEADCNQDTVVDFGDISAFIAILQGS